MNEKSTVPSYYDMCVVSECPKASTCLRHVALPMTGEQKVRIFNPHLLDKTGKCPHYVKAEKVFHAKGFKEVMEKLPHGTYKRAVSALMSYFSERTYYRIRKGKYQHKSPAELTTELYIMQNIYPLPQKPYPT